MDQSLWMTKNFVVLLLLYFNSSAQGAPKIVAPYPDNPYAIQNEVAKVTCVVEDSVSNPDVIIFVRKSRFGDVEPIRDEGPDGRIYYRNETLDGGRKLRVTLHFNKVIVNDDSRNGGYECQGHSGGSQHEYGFTVTVIQLSEIPEVHASGDVTAKFGKRIQLSCNVTIANKGALRSTTIGKFTWAKDGRVVIASYCRPHFSSIKPLVLNVSLADVGGTYSCYLEYLLRGIRKINITKTIIVKVQPRFFPEKKEEKNVKRLVCTAQGNPLVTEWKRKSLLNDDFWVFDTKDNSSKGKYVFSNMDGFKDHTLTIYDVQPKDAGQYYCCIKNITSPRAPKDISNCQIFEVQPQPQPQPLLQTQPPSPLTTPPPGSLVGKASLTFSIILLDLLLNWLL